MSDLLKGKYAVITGASTGIGRAIALGFAAKGCAGVAINYYPDTPEQRENVAAMAEEIKSKTQDTCKFVAFPGDISKPETSTELVASVMAEFPVIDIGVSNAGVCQFSKFVDVTPELLKFTVDINLNGCFFFVQAVAKQMLTQERDPVTGSRGSLIGISSISALVGGAFQTHYCPTKAGILSLMQSTACALGPDGIRSNAVLPGTIATQLNEKDLQDETKRTMMMNRIPLKRLGHVDDLVGPCAFLGSDLSLYCNGSQVLVDGGAFVNLQ